MVAAEAVVAVSDINWRWLVHSDSYSLQVATGAEEAEAVEGVEAMAVEAMEVEVEAILDGVLATVVEAVVGKEGLHQHILFHGL